MTAFPHPRGVSREARLPSSTGTGASWPARPVIDRGRASLPLTSAAVRSQDALQRWPTPPTLPVDIQDGPMQAACPRLGDGEFPLATFGRVGQECLRTTGRPTPACPQVRSICPSFPVPYGHAQQTLRFHLSRTSSYEAPRSRRVCDRCQPISNCAQSSSPAARYKGASGATCIRATRTRPAYLPRRRHEPLGAGPWFRDYCGLHPALARA